MRKHHKVSPASIYHNHELDAPYPWEDYLLRLPLALLVIVGWFSWTLVPRAIIMLAPGHVAVGSTSDLESVMNEGLAGVVLVFVLWAALSAAGPKLIAYQSFLRAFLHTSPPGFFLFFVPTRIIKLGRGLLLWFRPTAPAFLERFLFTIVIIAAPTFWLGIAYLVRIWFPFAPYVLDKIVMIDVCAATLLSFPLNRLIDRTRVAKNNPYGLVSSMWTLVLLTNPVLLVIGLIDEIHERYRDRR